MFIHLKWYFITSFLLSLFLSRSNAEIIINGETMGTYYNIEIFDEYEVINNYSYLNNQIDSILKNINFHLMILLKFLMTHYFFLRKYLKNLLL